jgi:hypothetical protein
MATLEATMKKHNINIDSTSSSYCHGHAIYDFGFSFNANFTTSSDEWLIDYGVFIWLRINPYFLLLMNVTPRQYLLLMIDLFVL